MFSKYIDQLGSQFSLLELSYIALATCIAIVVLLRWFRLGDANFSKAAEDSKRYFKERPWWQSSTAFVAHFLLVFLRGAAEGMVAAALLLVVVYHIYPELGAIRE